MIMPFSYSAQRGRSLVEVMIAMTIGLVILVAVTSLFVSSKQTFRATDDKGRLEEDGRLALNLLAFHLRMAGYGPLVSNSLQGKSPKTNMLDDNVSASVTAVGIAGCTGGFVSAANVVRSCNNTAAADGVLVRYVAELENSNVTAASVPTDCLGQAIIRVPAVVENRFYVASNATTGLTELYCQGSGSTASNATTFVSPAQPVAENIMDMRISYGFSNADDGQSSDAFFSASQIDDPTLPDPAVQYPDSYPVAISTPNAMQDRKWMKVMSAKICLVVRSANDGIATIPQQYRDCTGTIITAPDRRLYQTFSTVIALRNRNLGSIN